MERPRSRHDAVAGSPGVHAVLDVLETLGTEGSHTLADLTRQVGISKTTVHRVCGALLERGWVLRDPATGAYSLGIRAISVAAAAAESPLVVAFRPVAADLLALHNETVHLTVLDGGDSLFVAKAETTHAVRLVSAVGSRLPAFASASGRVLLADLPSEVIEVTFAGHRARDADRTPARRPAGSPAAARAGARERVRGEHRGDGARAALHRRSRPQRQRSSARGDDSVRPDR